MSLELDLTDEQAADLVSRTLAVLEPLIGEFGEFEHYGADRERITNYYTTLQLLDAGYASGAITQHYWHHIRQDVVAGITLTASLYGVTL